MAFASRRRRRRRAHLGNNGLSYDVGGNANVCLAGMGRGDSGVRIRSRLINVR